MTPVIRTRVSNLFDREALSLLWHYLRPHRLSLVVAVLGAILQSLLVLPVLWLLRHAFDVTIPAGNVRGLVAIGGIILLVRAVGSGLSLLLRRRMLRLVKGAVTDLRLDLLSSLLHQSREQHDAMDLSQAHTRVVQESERIDRVATAILSGLLPSLLSAVGVAIVLLVLDLRMAVLGMVVLPLVWLAGRRLHTRVESDVRRFQRSFEGFSRGVNFVLRQLDVVRLAAAEAQELQRQRARLDDVRDQGVQMAMTFAVHSQVQRTLIGLAGISILVVGGIGVASGRLSIGAFITFYVAAGLLNGHVDTVLSALPEIVAGNVSLRTLRSMLHDAEPEPYQGRTVVPATGAVSLHDVGFSYGTRRVLHAVSLDVAPMDNVAIVGENGAGKSTIAKLIAGLHRPRHGHIRWSGVPYDEVHMPSLRRALGMVQQHATFFPGTIRENLLYGHADVSDDQLAQALYLATADQVVARLPLGLETPTGELGQLLSGGERQRLAISRALVGNPILLLLDEPTTHLDLSSIGEVMTRILSRAERPAVLTITHDPSVEAFAETVYRLEDGQLSLVPSRGGLPLATLS
ncbi:MAG: ABC transporter ATP-binding protein [Gemmatimonadota bacterium]